MKLSVSLPDDDVAFLDAYAERHRCASRSAVLRTAVRLLVSVELEASYGAAWREWSESGEADVWDRVTPDRPALR